jgi:hypothetical protein
LVLDTGGWQKRSLGRHTAGKETRYPCNRRIVGMDRSGKPNHLEPSSP